MHLGREHDHLLVDAVCFLQPAEHHQRVGAVEQEMRLLGAEHERLVVAFQRLGVAAHLLQQRAAVDPVRRRGGVERQRPVEADQRLLGKPRLRHQIGAVAVRLGEIGIERDRRVEGLGRLGQRPEPLLRLADQVVDPRLRLADRERALGELDALLELALLAGHQGDVIERVGVLGVVAQDLGVLVHGLGQLALAVVEKALLQELRGRERIRSWPRV